MAVPMAKYPEESLSTMILLKEGYDHEVLKKHYFSLMQHIEAVHEAGEMLGVDKSQLEIHDLSKFSYEEFGPYAMHFHGGGAPQPFARAWLHHIHHNPHHWEHWIFPDNYTPRDSHVERGAVEMPGRFVLEMIADWIGSSVVYTGSDDMTQWLRQNFPRIRVHTHTASLLRRKLCDLGYDFVYDLRFKHELEIVATPI